LYVTNSVNKDSEHQLFQTVDPTKCGMLQFNLTTGRLEKLIDHNCNQAEI